MTDKFLRIALLVIICHYILFITYIYSHLPNALPIHWNLYGHVDVYSNNKAGPVLLSLASVIVFPIMLMWLSKRPRGNTVASHLEDRGKFNLTVLLLSVLSVYLNVIYFLFVVYDISHGAQLALTGVYTFLYLYGHIMKDLPRNYWNGIRTRWTLTDQQVWNDTHRFSSLLFKVTAIVSLILTWFFSLLTFPLCLLIITAVPLLYSYRRHRKLNSAQ